MINHLSKVSYYKYIINVGKRIEESLLSFFPYFIQY